MGQEDFEEIDHDLPSSEIVGLDTPSGRPVIDIEIVLLERRGELIAGGREANRVMVAPRRDVLMEAFLLPGVLGSAALAVLALGIKPEERQ